MTSIVSRTKTGKKQGANWTMGGHLTVRVVVVREGSLEEESGIQNGPDERVGGGSKE